MDSQLPLPTAVNVSQKNRTFDVAWESGHVSRFRLEDLRALCDCAECREERRRKDEQPRSRALPVLGPATRSQIGSVENVGRYAFGVKWKDGHYSIYSYRSLFDSCPCDQCGNSLAPVLS